MATAMESDSTAERRTTSESTQAATTHQTMTAMTRATCRTTRQTACAVVSQTASRAMREVACRPARLATSGDPTRLKPARAPAARNIVYQMGQFWMAKVDQFSVAIHRQAKQVLVVAPAQPAPGTGTK